jgi:hypothetical protein
MAMSHIYILNPMNSLEALGAYSESLGTPNQIQFIPANSPGKLFILDNYEGIGFRQQSTKLN